MTAVMRVISHFALLTIILFWPVAHAEVDCFQSDLYGSWTCMPPGSGPFPGVLYNHGGFGPAVGGDLYANALGLAEAGFLAAAKARKPSSISIPDSLSDVVDGYVMLVGYGNVDVDRLAVVGFSRGALLSLRLAEMYPETLKTVAMMAPAPGKIFDNGNTTLSLYLEDEELSSLDASARFLLMVSENDVDESVDHVGLVDQVRDALLGQEITTYHHLLDAWDDPDDLCPGTDPVGHCVFQGVDDGGQEPGLTDDVYFYHLVRHLACNLGTNAPGTSDVTGDLSGDGTLNILDVVSLVALVLDGDAPDACVAMLGDINHDDALNVLDVVGLVALILS